jgi:hypothetical protein
VGVGYTFPETVNDIEKGVIKPYIKRKFNKEDMLLSTMAAK